MNESQRTSCNQRTRPRECARGESEWDSRQGQGEVVKLDRAIGYGGDEEGVLGFRPSDVVYVISGKPGDGCGGASSRREVEDVEVAIVEDAEVLRNEKIKKK